MSAQAATYQNDPLLHAFLKASNEAEADDIISQLVFEHAAPVIKTIIRNKLQVTMNEADGSLQNQDALEIDSDVKAQILTELRALKKSPGSKAINNFRSYVAVVTFHSCYEYLRRKYPQRASLKDKIRHLLNNHEEFSLWESNNKEFICGFERWYRQNMPSVQPMWPDQINLSGNVQSMPLQDLLASIFNALNGPIKLDNLVNIVADICGIKDQAEDNVIDEDERQTIYESLPDTRINIAQEVEQRIYLQRLWKEICELPLKQRIALLLNLRDGNGRTVLTLLPYSRVATIRQIAEVLDMSAEKFATMCSDLPLDDATIASHLGIPRQQVINLRLSARERLARRMKALEKGT
jgi:hypothetical protein